MTTPVAGPAEAPSNDHNDCGTLAGNAWVHAFVPAAPGLPVLDGSYPTDVANAINGLAVPNLSAVAEYPGDVVAWMQQVFNAGSGALVTANVNTWDCWPNPNGGAKHWLATYDPSVRAYNCWNAAYQQYDPQLFQAAYAACGLGCVRVVYTTEDAMTPEQAQQLADTFAMVKSLNSWAEGTPTDKFTALLNLLTQLDSWAQGSPLDKFTDILERVKAIEAKLGIAG